MGARRRKWLILTGLLVVVGGGAGLAFVVRRGGDDRIEVQTEPVQRMTIVQTVSATGRIQPKTQVKISADVSAKITALAVREGETVAAGDFLLELDSQRYAAQVESAEANLRVAQAQADVSAENLTKAEKDYVRIRDLFDEELETESALDAARAVYQAEKARQRSMLDEVVQARAALRQSRDDLSKTRIYAPMAGTVSKLNKEVGEIALGSQFQEDVILELSNLTGMEALVDVDENDVVLLSEGDRATIEVDALPDVKLTGIVTDIASSAKVTGSGTTDQKTEFEVRIAVDAPDRQLRPGMTASAEVTTETHDDAVGVPIQCVALRSTEQLGAPGPSAPEWKPDEDGFVQVVFVVDQDSAAARPVRTGIQGDTHIEITEGLEPGQQVVVGSYRAISKDLSHGTAVTVAQDETKKKKKKKKTKQEEAGAPPADQARRNGG
jgi:HlyD family secretion protein